MFKDKNSKSYFLYSFLLDISSPLINYIIADNLYDFAEQFIAHYRKNYFFNNNHYYNAQSEDQLEIILTLTGQLYQQLNNLDCCPTHDSHHEETTRQEISVYIKQLFMYINVDQIVSELSLLPQEFHEDYRITYENLIHGNINLAEAEKSLSCWQLAFAEDKLHMILFLMRYSYLGNLMVRAESSINNYLS